MTNDDIRLAIMEAELDVMNDKYNEVREIFMVCESDLQTIKALYAMCMAWLNLIHSKERDIDELRYKLNHEQ